jgi:hypothetical protein
LSEVGSLKEVKGEILDKVSDADFKLDYGRLFSWDKTEIHWFVLGGLGAMLNGASQPVFAVIFSKMLTILGTPQAPYYF